MQLCSLNSLNNDVLLRILEYCDIRSICILCEAYASIHELVKVSENHVCKHLMQIEYNVTKAPNDMSWSLEFFNRCLESFAHSIENGSYITCKQIKVIANYFSTFDKLHLFIEFIDKKNYISSIHNYLLKHTEYLFGKKNWERKNISKLPILFLSFGCSYDPQNFVHATLCRDKQATKFMLKNFSILKDSIVCDKPLLFYMKQYFLKLKFNGKMSSGCEYFVNSIINTLLNKKVNSYWNDGTRIWSFIEYCHHLETQLSKDT